MRLTLIYPPPPACFTRVRVDPVLQHKLVLRTAKLFIFALFAVWYKTKIGKI